MAKTTRPPSEAELQRLYSIFEQAPAMIAVLQGPDHVFVFANDYYLRATGKTKAIFGKPISTVFPELQQLGLYDIFDRIYSSGETYSTREILFPIARHDNGKAEEAYLDISFQPYRDAAGAVAGVLTHAVDVSEQVRTRERLKQSEERFRTLIQKSADAIQMVDPEGKVLYSSDSIRHVLGYTPEEIQGVSVAPYIHPDDWGGFSAQWAMLLAEPLGTLSLTYRVRHKDGSWRWLETTITNHLATPTINAVVGNFRDITERRKAERALRDSEARLRRLVEANVIGIIFWNIQGVITYANDIFLQMVGYTKRDLVQGNIDWIHMTPPEFAEGDEAAVKALNELGFHGPLEKQYLRKDGSRVTVVVGSAFFDDAKKDGIGFVLDITDYRRTTEQRDKLQQTTALLEEQRMRLISINQAKDEFISLASHQLRTPASAVKQYLGLVLEGYVGDITEQQQYMLTQANHSNERQIKVIDNLLRVARADAGRIEPDFKPCDMAAMLTSVIQEQMHTFTERSQTVEYTPRKTALIVDADARLIRMALENIVDNASKYTPPHKTVRVTLSVTKTEVVVKVADQGVGIAKKDLDALFKKFSRIDNPLSAEVGGTGLGLYWAQKVVELHRGSIGVQSQVDKGTT
ncbi:MAG TPA: PAS domain S-box protein, partial [Candidatus Saccharimonadales bacterium]|nr:PAS domain S-box protein [Candidatus Saccharimonadales bacterium]